MSIRYLNDAANNIQYTNKNGETITKNPFDADFVFISQRLSLIHSNDAENQQNRRNYENAVRDAQRNIDAGRPATIALPVPVQKFTPEDFSLPEYTSTWDPPLLTLTNPTPPPPQSVGFGPDAPARLNPGQVALATALSILSSVGPALPDLIRLLQSLHEHHQTTAASVADFNHS